MMEPIYTTYNNAGYSYDRYLLCYFMMLGGMFRYTLSKDYANTYSKVVNCIEYQQSYRELIDTGLKII